MGNTEIPLPNDMGENISDPSKEILDGTSPQELQRVLKNENVMKNEINKSSPRSLTVLHALGSQVRKSSPVGNVTGKPMVSQPTKSWAEVVSHR
jgi:hypothetical protein